MTGILRYTLAWLEIRAAEVSGLAMFVMVFAVTVDVFLRYSVNAALSWSYDLVSMYLLPAIVFLSLASVQRQRHHINVDLFYRKCPPAMQRLSAIAGLIGSGAVLAIMSFVAGRRAWTAVVESEVVSGPIPWPVWIGPALLAFGAGLFVLRATADIAGVATGAIDPPETRDSEQLEPTGPV